MLKGYRTLIINILIVVFGALDAATLTPILPPAYAPLVISAIGALNIWLRTQTNTAVTKAE